MANVLGDLFSDIANAIRSKTGETGKMKPIEFPEKIAAIQTGGGGGSGDVRYVTFLSHDGTVILGIKAVAVGDDCADPVDRGLFDTPTRESTAQNTYTFAGWATVANGAASANALKAVTEDRTVYAAYTASVRKYTITYYDGNTLLKTESLAYGAMPSYVPEKQGFSFDGWEPALAPVSGDAVYTAKWIDLITFANGSWEDIISIAEAGDAQKYFSLGDTRSLVYTDPSGASKTITIQIVGFEVDDLADGSGKAAVSIMTNKVAFQYAHTSSSSIAYDWATSRVREALNDTVFSSFPETLKNGIKSVKKIHRKYVDGTAVTGLNQTTDKVWLPSAGEIGQTTDSSGYSYYPEKSSEGSVRYSGIYGPTICQQKHNENGTNSADTYLAYRSTSPRTTYNCLNHQYSGTVSRATNIAANRSALWCTFGFCI